VVADRRHDAGVVNTLNASIELFGTHVFCPYDIETNEWETKPHRAFYDAVMVGISKHLDRMADFPKYARRIVGATKQLFVAHPNGTFTGRGNTKRDVQDRINLMLEGVLVG
jgi:hypothetical protein